VTALGDLLVALLEAVPADVGDEHAGVRVAISDLAIDLPVETRIGADGTLRASAPRGRLATGFDPPLGAMHVAFSREPA
jgi:hypothetical protein